MTLNILCLAPVKILKTSDNIFHMTEIVCNKAYEVKLAYTIYWLVFHFFRCLTAVCLLFSRKTINNNISACFAIGLLGLFMCNEISPVWIDVFNNNVVNGTRVTTTSSVDASWLLSDFSK